MSLTVTLLAYHEAENLRWLLPELQRIVEPLDIATVEYLVVDSPVPTDDTEAVCKSFGVRYVNQTEPGYGGAYRTAIGEASNELFLSLDADGSQDYKQIPLMYREAMQGADVVVGSRFLPGVSTDDACSSRVMFRLLNFFFRIGTGVDVHDFFTSLRICKTQDLKHLHLTSRNFDILGELILKLKLSKKDQLVIREIPFSSCASRQRNTSRHFLKRGVVLLQLLVYSIVLRLIGAKNYRPSIHDARAREISDFLLYGAVGVLTTLLNVVTYFALRSSMNYLWANLCAWAVSVLFAFFANKTIVFDDWKMDIGTVSKEGASFVGARIFAGVLDMSLLWFMIEVLSVNEDISKITDLAVVIILNYFLSKYYIFVKPVDKGAN